jgi:hypothetical protein
LYPVNPVVGAAGGVVVKAGEKAVKEVKRFINKLF